MTNQGKIQNISIIHCQKIWDKHLYDTYILMKYLFCSLQGKRKGCLLRTAVNEEQVEKSWPKPCIREDMRKDKVIQEKSRWRSTSIWWPTEKLESNRKAVRKSRPFTEAGEEEPKSTGTVKLQSGKLVLPAEHHLDSSYQCNATKMNRIVGGLFGLLPPP